MQPMEYGKQLLLLHSVLQILNMMKIFFIQYVKYFVYITKMGKSVNIITVSINDNNIRHIKL